MKMMISIALKEGVLDPQGQAIQNALSNLGWHEVQNISTDKQIILDIEETDPDSAKQKCARMCENLLVNTVIENYEISIIDESA